MNLKIEDEFTRRTDITRQRRWQLRKQRDGRCHDCGAETTSFRCEAHTIDTRENQRRYQGCKRRNLGAASYGFAESPAKITS
jgi:hypothetical protein